jgi:hypothetical protein
VALLFVSCIAFFAFRQYSAKETLTVADEFCWQSAGPRYLKRERIINPLKNDLYLKSVYVVKTRNRVILIWECRGKLKTNKGDHSMSDKFIAISADEYDRIFSKKEIPPIENESDKVGPDDAKEELKKIAVENLKNDLLP